MTLAKGGRCVRRGQGHSYTLDGRKVPGVTTILKGGLPKPALVGWAAREAAMFVASRREILTQLTDAELIDLVKGAANRKRDSAAVRGTEVHTLAQRLAAGEPVEVREEIRPQVDHYLGFLEAYQPYNALVEVPVFSRRYLYGGTADLIAETKHPRIPGRVLFDIKTSGSGIYSEIALQMAGYGNAEFYANPPDYQEHPLPPIDHYAAVWVRADGYDVYPVTVTEREWKTFLFVAQVHWWLENRARDLVGESIWEPEEVKAS